MSKPRGKLAECSLSKVDNLAAKDQTPGVSRKISQKQIGVPRKISQKPQPERGKKCRPDSASTSNTKGKDRHSKDKREETSTNYGALAYQILPQDVCKELLEMDVDDMQRRMREFFSFSSSETDLKEAATLDYYVGAVWWAKEQGFTDQQLSGFFTAIHTLLDNIKEKQISLVDNVTELKKMLVGIGADVQSGAESGGMEFFDPAQGSAISSYVFTSLFQHHRLYEFMFHETQDEEIIGTDLDVEVAKAASFPFPPPLDEGIEEDKFQAFVKTPPPSPTPEPGKETTDEGASELSATQQSALDLDAEFFAQLTPQDVTEVVQSVANEMLGGLQNEVSVKLREKENAIIAQINKIHRVAEN